MYRSLSLDEIAEAFGALSQLAPLGEPGGSGECWQAKSTEFGDVALKVLVRPHDRRRFDREIEGLKRVSSPYVMTLHDAGFVDCGGASRPYLVSGLIEGPSLRAALSDGELGATAEWHFLSGSCAACPRWRTRMSFIGTLSPRTWYCETATRLIQ